MRSFAFLKAATLVLLVLFALTPALSQVRTVGQIVGVVEDQTGAIVLGAKLTLVDEATGLTRTATSTTDGRFVFVDLPNGTYKLTTTMEGFRTAVYPGIKVDVGRTTDVTVKLEVGAVTSTVVVEGAAEILQTSSTTVESTVTGRTLRSLPLNNRDVLDFVLLMAGAQQGGTARQSTFEGLPKGALNITMDGINIQDNTLKSSSGGGMFTIIRPKLDSVEEISVTSATAGADAAGEGAVQIKFVTRRGTNDWHGSTFWYHRNDFFNANTWFNNALGRKRPRNLLNQYGFNLGGPLIKDKLFIFGTFEDFRLPGSLTRENTILTAEAQTGVFRYKGTDGVERTANLLNIAAANGLTSTIDPLVSSMMAQINAARSAGSVSNRDLFRQRLRWEAPSSQRRWFPTVRVDYHITSKLRWHAVGNWNHFDSLPDTLNSMDPSLPGLTGGSGQYSRRWSLSTAVNWEIRPNLTYEFRLGRQRAPVHFFPESLAQNPYPQGFRLVWPSVLSLQNLHTRPGAIPTTTRSLGSNRDAPTINWGNNVGWVRGKHTFNFGTALSVYTLWDSSTNNFGVPNVTLGMASNDPGAAAFSSTTLPSISSTDLPNARALYGLLTGRIASISGSRNVDDVSKSYVPGVSLTERDRQNEFGIYFADSWRALPTLTINYGLRWEYQGALYNTNGIFTSPTFADLWGKSGVSNLFKPGTLSGAATPQILQRSRDLSVRHYKNFAPSFGLAWTPHFKNGLWDTIFGGPGKIVFRSGYSIAYTREGLNHFSTFAGGNPGTTQSITLNPGDPGFPTSDATRWLLLRNPFPPLRTLPTSFSFPLAQSSFTFGNNMFSIDPNLRTPYVQSWTFGIQRQLSPDMVLEVRYVGNRGTRLWRGFNLNEVNIFENGFLDEFKRAVSNLAICRAQAAACRSAQQAAGVLVRDQTVNNFANWGLAGQANLGIFSAAFGPRGTQPRLTQPAGFANGTFVTFLDQGQAGNFANSLGGSPTFLCRMVGSALQACTDRGFAGAGALPANFFQVNPDAAGGIGTPCITATGGGACLLSNGSLSTYHGLQVEFRRRMARGLMVSGNYTWSKSLTNLFADSSTSTSNFTSLRSPGQDKGPSPWDIRHSLRAYWIYELPFGPGRKWSTGNSAVNKAIEGWEALGVVAVQTGRVFKLTSGRGTVNQFDSGVTLKGITVQQLQSMVGIVKPQAGMPCSSAGAVFFLDPGLFGSDCRSNTTFLDAPQIPGQLGQFVYLYGPRFVKPDLTIAKKTKVSERVTTEFRAEFFNAFNYQNFIVGAPGSAGITNNIRDQGAFGTTSVIFNDLGNQDPGPRMIQFVLRISF